MKQPSWKPKRKGNLYCSPACGAGCTVEQHHCAVTGGWKLAAKLGTKWKPRVWENMGWFYEVVSPCGQIVVRPSGFVDFHLGGDGRQIYVIEKTPIKGLKQLRRKLTELQQGIERALGN